MSADWVLKAILKALREEARPARPPSRFRAWFRVAALAMPTLAALTIAAGFYALVVHQDYAAQQFAWEGDSYIQEDPDIGYVLRPNAHVRLVVQPKFDFYSDDRGGRTGSAGQRAPKSVQVLVTGCSFTWGQGVSHEETYASELGRRLGVSTYNVGVPSYGTTGALLSLNHFADLHPKVVVYGFIKEHALRNLQPYAPSVAIYPRPVAFVDFDQADRPFIHGPVGDVRDFNRYTAEVVLRHPFGWRDVYWAAYRDFKKLTDRTYRTTGVVETETTREAIRAYDARYERSDVRTRALTMLLRKMHERTRELGASLVLVYMPSTGALPVDGPAELKASLASLGEDARDIAFVDMTEPFKELTDRGGVEAAFLENDFHPTAEAHRRVAESLEPVVRRLLDQPSSR